MPLHLTKVAFLGGALTGMNVLMLGLVVCSLGVVYGWMQYLQTKNLPVHPSMSDVSQIIWETCKTYLWQQGKFLAVLRWYLHANQYTTIISTMIAVVEQGDVPARTHFVQEVHQCARPLGKLEAIKQLVLDPRYHLVAQAREVALAEAGVHDRIEEELGEAVRDVAAVPLIASGGAGSVEHFAPAVRAGADAVLAASVFHSDQLTITDVKNSLRAEGIEVR